jgi:hypothetical protein
MPKIEIDYSNTIIYKITCKDPSITDVYVGHTTNFVQRKHCHKQSCNNDKSSNHNCKLYKVIMDNGGWQNWTMEIVNFFNCHDHYEARKKEQEYFTLLNATLNSIEPMPKPKEKKVIIKCNPKPTLTDDACNKIFGSEKIYDESQTTTKFICENCDYKCSRKFCWEQHLSTSKHKFATSGYINATDNYKCECGKKYKHHPSFYRHKKKCNAQNINHYEKTEFSSLDMNLIMQLLKQNDEFKALIIEQNTKLIEAYKNNTTNINNSTF